MPVTMKQVRACLDPEEPNYPAAAKLGAEAVPHLKKLVKDADAMLASKAAYMASLIPVESSLGVLEDAARHGDPVVRVAVAAAVGNVPGDLGSDVLAPLVGDADPGVRKVALASVHGGAGEALRARVEEVARAETEPGLQALSIQALERIGGEGASASFAPGVAPETAGAPEPDEPEEGFGGGSVDDEEASLVSGLAEEDDEDGMGGGGDDDGPSDDAGAMLLGGGADDEDEDEDGMGGGGDEDDTVEASILGSGEDGMGGGEVDAAASESPGAGAFGGGNV